MGITKCIRMRNTTKYTNRAKRRYIVLYADAKNVALYWKIHVSISRCATENQRRTGESNNEIGYTILRVLYYHVSHRFIGNVLPMEKCTYRKLLRVFSTSLPLYITYIHVCISLSLSLSFSIHAATYTARCSRIDAMLRAITRIITGSRRTKLIATQTMP